MDPNTALETLRKLSRMSLGEIPGDYEGIEGDLAEAFIALDEWVSRGGFLPSDWSAHRVPK